MQFVIKYSKYIYIQIYILYIGKKSLEIFRYLFKILSSSFLIPNAR